MCRPAPRRGSSSAPMNPRALVSQIVRRADEGLDGDYLTNGEDAELTAVAVQQQIFRYRTNPNLTLAFGPVGRSHPDLNPNKPADVSRYVRASDPWTVGGVFFARLIINHWGGTCPLGGGIDPATLRVEGTQNVHVVDASPGCHHHGRRREGERPPHRRAGAGPPARLTMNTRTRGAIGAPSASTCSAPR